MHLVAALDTVLGVKPILGLHETVCSGAADGYARMARKPAMTVLHLGPGLANALANMHNARRAGSPMVNVIGDMATWHKDADPLLNMDIRALAQTVSRQVITVTPGVEEESMARACDISNSSSVAGQPRIVTLVVPHDVSWSETPPSPIPPPQHTIKPFTATHQEFLTTLAKELKQYKSKAALFIGNQAALSDSLQSIGRIAVASGCALYCENSFARLDRGTGLPNLTRLPYFPQDAQAALSKFEAVVLVDARRPVANFGYEGGPSHLIDLPDDHIWELDSSDVDIALAMKFLCTAVGGDAVTPGVNCGGVFCMPSKVKSPLPPKNGRLNPTYLCQIVAHLQPKDAIIVDESLTSGNAYWDASRGCPPFTHLCLTGGAIGCGPPLAVGAAVACPERVVINIQADGSGMYSAQALWTQAREGLRVVTIICANRTYSILKVEMAKQRITPSNGAACKSLTELGNPPIDWAKLANGMGVGAATRAETCEAFIAQLTAALERPGPSLIECLL